MAIDGARFAGRLEAELSYLLSLAPDEASSRIEGLWTSGAWRNNPTRWLQRISKLQDTARWTPERCGELTLETLQALGWSDAKPHLHNAFLLWANGTEGLARRVATWVAEHADAGDADVVLKTAERFIDRFGHAATSLIDWTMEHAISTLRSPHRISLLRTVFTRLIELERRGDAALLLNLMLSIDRAFRDWPQDLPLWELVESSGLGPERLSDLIHGLLRVGATHLAFQPLRDFRRYPDTGRHVFGMLAAGEVPRSALELGWEIALRGSPPSTPDGLTSISSLDAALAKLLWCEGEVDRVPWARLFAEAYWRLWRDPTDDGHVLSLAPVRKLAGWRDDVARGVGEALKQRLQSMTGESADLAREILAEGPPGVFRVAAALDCFMPSSVTAPPPKPPRPDDREVERLRHHLERFIATPWPSSVCGLDVGALLRNVTSVELVELDGGDKVRLAGQVLKVARDYPDDLLRDGLRDDALLQAAFLYVAHELVHLPQGLGDIQSVRRLRAAGAESVLMHIDLTADHIAALMVHTAVRRWSLVDLKAAILESLAAFAAGPFHTDASRLRKSLRYVSERLDLLLRRASPQTDMSGYWFLDFGPLGGPAFVFISGPPLRLVGEVPLSKEETDTLMRACDGGDAALAADRVVERIARGVSR